MTTTENTSSLFQVRLKLVFTAIFWGGTFIAGRVVTRYMGPFSAAFLRFLIASVFLFFLIWREEKRIPLLSYRQFFLLVLLGISGIFAYNYFFFSGLKLINAGRAAIIIANNPIFISLFSVLIFKEKLTALRALGILLSVSGAIWAISRGNVGMVLGQVGLGEIFISLCVASWVTYTMIGKAIMMRLSPLLSVAYSSLIGTLLLLYPALQEGLWNQLGSFHLNAWASVFYLGFFGTVLGFIWYYQGIKELGPMKASIFINFVPISAIILSFLILQEPITISLLGGALLVITGVYFTNVSQIRQPRRLK